MTGTVGFLLALAGLALGAGLGWVLSQRMSSYRVRAQRLALEHALSEARTDALTGLGNRKAFDEHLALLTAMARRYGGPMSLILFDLDGLKQVNDSLGHAAGDAALIHFAGVIRDSTRESDVSARLGGDEFAVLLPHTDARGAGILSERIHGVLQAAYEAFQSAPAGAPVLRASTGIAEWRADETPAELLARADESLYGAKQAKDDRIAAAEQPQKA